MTNQLEKLVTSLEMSKRLKEAGVEIETPFYWAQEVNIFAQRVEGEFYVLVGEVDDIGEDDLLERAYTFQQLWEPLVNTCERNELEFMHGDRELFINGEGFGGDNWPDTAAEALLWCLENDYITLDEVNNG